MMEIKFFVVAVGTVCFVVRELVPWRIPKLVVVMIENYVLLGELHY